MFASFDLLYAFAHRYLCSAWRSSKSSPCRAPLCASDDTTTTRDGALARNRSSNRSVSRKWPRWLTPNVSSKPSSVSARRCRISPALFTSTSRWSKRSSASAANDLIDRKLARSRGMTSTESFPLRSVISCRAARPRSSLREVMTTWAPRPASATAASFPIPVFPPVITTTLPAMSVMTDNAIRDRTSDETVACESTCDHRDRHDRAAGKNLTALRGRKIGTMNHGEYLPIENHGVIGDLHTVALVGTDGTIDFMSYPHFGSSTIFASLLDAENGGRFQLRPCHASGAIKQMYLPDTNVLITRTLDRDGVAEVSDFMPVGTDEHEHCHAVVRRAKGVRGESEFE